MKKLLLIILLVLAACNQSPKEPAASGSNRATAAWEMINDGALVVDVRSPEEFSAGHVDGAINIPQDQIAMRLDEIADHKNKDVVLYCKSGRRAGLAEETLKTNGFTHVLNGGGYSEIISAR
ncbi:MAG: rhodanese-like domain-containing protein [Bdellovibrionales bacterium]|nr:rhodanese-like domain-containing protein [Bdellovibrionales bacterium]